MKDNPQDRRIEDQTATQALQNQLDAHRRTLIFIGMILALVVALVLFPQEALSAIAQGFTDQPLIPFLLLLFGLVTVSLLWSAGQRLDVWLFMWINLRAFQSPWLDRFMWLATQIGNGGLALLTAALLYLFGYPRLGIEMILGTTTLWLVVELIKSITARARPYQLLEKTRVVGWPARGRSFPSGHTAQSFFLMSLLAQYFQLGFIGALGVFLTAVLVGFTRIYIGVHYPRDTLAGAILGSVWGILMILIDPYLMTRFPG